MQNSISKRFRKFLRIILIRIPLLLVLLSVGLVYMYKYVPVYVTPLMLKRTVEYWNDKDFHTAKKWVPYEEISPEMVRCVMASEDTRFLTHKGFDIEELKKMKKEHEEKGKPIRGCSTISQQTAKNCFTFCSSTWARKGLEAYYTFLIEKIWGKKRIMEVYLNVIEMGKGIYGIQAAAQKYYGIDASDLAMRQCTAITVCLPNPLKRTPSWADSHRRDRQATIARLARGSALPE